MGLTTVIKDYGTEILNAIRDNNLQALKAILEKQLRSDSKIAKLCVTDIKHKPSKKFACPIILAARLEDPSIIEYMMMRGVDPNFIHHTVFTSRKRETITALHVAVDLCNYDVIEVLLNANADCNLPDHNEETALHLAVKKADRIMVRMLLSKGANPSVVDKHQNAPLHVATLYGHLQIVRTLLKYDADIFQKGEWDAVPPHIAAREGHIHLIQLFCKRYIGNVNVKIPCFLDMREKAPLHLAAENAHTETVVALLDQFEADVNLKDSDGNTPLHCVVLSPYNPHRMQDKDSFNETARMLIKFQSLINEKNEFGDTPLHLAAMHHFQRIVEMLLAVGANPFMENNEHLKPIDLVPDSDPVTRQILKNAMSQPKGTISGTLERLRRDLDLNPITGHHYSHSSQGRSSTMTNSVVHERRKPDQRLSNIDSVSLASDLEDPNQSHLPLPSLPLLNDNSPREEQIIQQVEKDSKTKRRQQKVNDILHASNSTPPKKKAVENEIAMHASTEHVPRRRDKKPPAPEPMDNDDDDVSTTISSVMTQDTYGQQLNQQAISQMAAKLAKKKLKEQRRRRRNSIGDSVLSEEITEPSFDQAPNFISSNLLENAQHTSNVRRKAKKDGDIVYENFKNSNLQQIKIQQISAKQGIANNKLLAEETEEKRHHRHHHRRRRQSDGSDQAYLVRPVRDKPGTIEVQYRGGPITIAVDTQGNACTLEHLSGMDQYVQQFKSAETVESTERSPTDYLPEQWSEFLDDEITTVTNDMFEQESIMSTDTTLHQAGKLGKVMSNEANSAQPLANKFQSSQNKAASIEMKDSQSVGQHSIHQNGKTVSANQNYKKSELRITGEKQKYDRSASDSSEDVSPDDRPNSVTEFSSFADKLAWAQQISKNKSPVIETATFSGKYDLNSLQSMPFIAAESKSNNMQQVSAINKNNTKQIGQPFITTSSSSENILSSSSSLNKHSYRSSENNIVQLAKVMDVSRVERLHTEVMPVKHVDQQLENRVLHAVVQNADIKIEKASIVTGHMERSHSVDDSKGTFKQQSLPNSKSDDAKFYSMELLPSRKVSSLYNTENFSEINEEEKFGNKSDSFNVETAKTQSFPDNFSSDEDLSLSSSSEKQTSKTFETTGSFTTTALTDMQGSFESNSEGAVISDNIHESGIINTSHAEVVDVLFNYSGSDLNSDNENSKNIFNEISSKFDNEKTISIAIETTNNVNNKSKEKATDQSTNEFQLPVKNLTGSPGSKRRGNKQNPSNSKQNLNSINESLTDRSFLADEEVAQISELYEVKNTLNKTSNRKTTPDANDMLSENKTQKPKPPIAEKPKIPSSKLHSLQINHSSSPVTKVSSRPSSASRMSPDVKITVVGDAKITAGGVVVATPPPLENISTKAKDKAKKKKVNDPGDEVKEENEKTQQKDVKKKKKKQSVMDDNHIEKLHADSNRSSLTSLDTLDILIPHEQISREELTIPSMRLPKIVNVKVQDEDRESSHGSVDLDVPIPTVFREDPVSEIFASKKQKLQKIKETDLDANVVLTESNKYVKKKSRKSKTESKLKASPITNGWKARQDQEEEMERVLQTLSGKLPDPAAAIKNRNDSDVELSDEEQNYDENYRKQAPIYISSEKHEKLQKHSQIKVQEPQPRTTGGNEKIYRPQPVYSQQNSSKSLLFSKPPVGKSHDTDFENPNLPRRNAKYSFKGSVIKTH